MEDTPNVVALKDGMRSGLRKEKPKYKPQNLFSDQLTCRKVTVLDLKYNCGALIVELMLLCMSTLITRPVADSDYAVLIGCCSWAGH